LNDYNTERDSVNKKIIQFKEYVQNLAETFKVTVESERLNKAKSLINEGRISEAQLVLNDYELTIEGNELLKESERLQDRTKFIDSLLVQKSEEYLVKAQIKALEYSDPKRVDSTIYCFQQSLRYFNSVETLNYLALFYSNNSFYDEAILTYQKLLMHPNVEDWRNWNVNIDLGDLYRKIGDLDKAIIIYRKSHETLSFLSKKDSTNTLWKYSLSSVNQRLGLVYTSKDSLSQALSFYEESRKLAEELYNFNQNNLEFKLCYIWANQFLGNVHNTIGDINNSLIFYEKMNKLLKEVYISDPHNAIYKNALAISYSKLGDIYFFKGKLDKSMEYYIEFNFLALANYIDNCNNAEYKNCAAVSFDKLGVNHSSLDTLGKALECFEKFYQLEKELNDTYPNNVEFKNGLAISNVRFGEFFQDKLNEKYKALSYFYKAKFIYIELIKDAPQFVEYQKSLNIIQLRILGLE
jgi:tetratricopeptide (TPR) repeat protein